MVGKKWLKLIKSLHQKKYRSEERLFFVEGQKIVKDFIQRGLTPVKIVAYPEYHHDFNGLDCELIALRELKSISALKNPNGVLAVFEMPKNVEIDLNNWILVLDDVRDPGNLGTIIRLCDWYNITDIICSPSTVDCYNPKVLQATMGSIAQVNIEYRPLADMLGQIDLPIYGAFMNGDSVYSENLSRPGILIMGNEANGISEEIESLVDKRLAIPQFGNKTTESLNVAMATGILLNEIRRG